MSSEQVPLNHVAAFMSDPISLVNVYFKRGHSF